MRGMALDRCNKPKDLHDQFISYRFACWTGMAFVANALATTRIHGLDSDGGCAPILKQREVMPFGQRSG